MQIAHSSAAALFFINPRYAQQSKHNPSPGNLSNAHSGIAVLQTSVFLHFTNKQEHAATLQ